MIKRKLVPYRKTDGLITSGRCSACGRRFIPKPGKAPNAKALHRDLVEAFAKHKCGAEVVRVSKN